MFENAGRSTWLLPEKDIAGLNLARSESHGADLSPILSPTNVKFRLRAFRVIGFAASPTDRRRNFKLDYGLIVGDGVGIGDGVGHGFSGSSGEGHGVGETVGEGVGGVEDATATCGSNLLPLGPAIIPTIKKIAITAM